MVRRQSIPENRVDLEIEIQDSDRQRNRANAMYGDYQCACGEPFRHIRVPQCCVQDLRCPACKEKK